ncbi:MAG: hypothetical protein ACYDAD_14515 [Acidimicrobiales bacterium]
MEQTEADRALAEEATMRLHHQGRADLSVSDAKARRWRQEDALPVLGNRRGGRHKMTEYRRPEAVEAAVALAISLSEPGNRNLDRAVLMAFARGAPIPEAGVVAAYRHYLQKMEINGGRLWKHRDRPRSEVKRSLRLPIPGSRRGDAGLISDALLAILLGDEPRGGSLGVDLAVDALLPEATPWLTSQLSRRVDARALIGRLSLAALRLVAREAKVGDLREACVTVRALIEYSESVSAILSATGESAETLPSPIDLLVPVLIRAAGYESRDLAVAMLGLILVALTPKRSARRHVKETADVCAKWLPHLRAIRALSEAIDPKWRPCLAAGTGLLRQAQLPQAERDALAAWIRQWQADNPALGPGLIPPDVTIPMQPPHE